MGTRPKKILVADDEPTLLQLVAFNLRVEGYEVVTARNGLEAVEKTQAERPDLVVLDVMMPKLDGFDVLQELKTNPETEHIPVIMLTALSDDGSVRQGWDRDVDCYLTKPFDPMELLSMVDRLLAVREAHGPGRAA
jgi:two-component system alkaline phosphatase synthesis response regulator PhoP/two-component system response regulator VicR